MVGVSATPPAAAERLAALFPADEGDSFPDERCALRALARRDATDGAAPRLPDLGAMLPARPFKWAQWLAGLGPVRPRPAACAESQRAHAMTPSSRRAPSQVVAADAPAPPSFQKVMDALLRA